LAQTPPGGGTQTSGTISFTLASLKSSDSHSFAVQNFAPDFGVLSDVTFTLTDGNKTTTIFDANDSAANWITVSLKPAGHPVVDGSNLANWGNSFGDLTISYKQSSRPISKDGIEGALLFSAPAQASAPYINVNYVYDLTNTNPNTTPEPRVGNLAAIALVVMSLLIWMRRSRTTARVRA
jgi:hypothetical protein